MVDVGVIFRHQMPPEDLRAAVTEAEEVGVSQLWLWAHCFAEGASAPRRPRSPGRMT